MPTQVDDFSASAESRLSAFEAGVEHHYAVHEGVRIHYAATGSGPLVVFLHGSPDHWLGWWQVMVGLQDGYRVVAVDLSGYNLSEKPDAASAYAIGNLVGDVQAVIRAEDFASAIVVGHDWGGFVARHAAMDSPDVVSGLVVLNMPHLWAIARELAQNPQQQKASDYVRFFKNPEARRQFPTERLSAWVVDPAYRKRHDKAMTTSSLDAIFNYYRVNWPAEPYEARADVPPKVQVPTLLFHGLQDHYAPPTGLNGVWDWVDQEVEILAIPGAGHFLQHEHAGRLVKQLRQWFPGVTMAGRTDAALLHVSAGQAGR